jgi:hypothetical protein
MKTKFTKGEWSQRKSFESAFLVKGGDTEWHHNEISIVDKTGRIICDVRYNTDHDNQGWGTNNSIELWEGNADLITDAGNTANKCGLLPSELLEQRDELLNVLIWVRRKYEYTLCKEADDMMDEAIKKATS